MYVNTSIRPQLDKQIESLAQAVAANSREGSSEYNFSAILAYAIARVAARSAKIQFKQIDYNSASAVTAALDMAATETADRVLKPLHEKQRNINGEIYGEIL